METFEQTFNSWNLDQKVEWILGPNICNLTNNARSIIVDLKEENQKLKQKSADDYIEYQNKTQAQAKRIAELENIVKVDDAICITKLEAVIKGKDYAIECYKNERENLEKKIKELEAENARLKAMKWISVDDVKPQWGIKVKVKFKDGSEDEVRFSHDYKWVSKGMATCESSEVTHWMPLPPTKESETKENG